MAAADDPPSSAAGRTHRTHRTWPERLAITGTFVSAVLCFAIAAALVGGYLIVRQRNIADFRNPAEIAAENSTTPPPTPADTVGVAESAASDATAADATTSSPPTGTSPDTTAGEAVETTPGTEAADSTESPSTTLSAPPGTFPDADPEASNFLITGADNGACVDPDSPYAGTFGDRESMGERSDTIMVLRVDPAAKRVAILSFPRDLYVEIADGGGMSRINSAYERDEPQRLADTIYNNFGIPIDHYIQVDFCAFKTLVDAVGGVTVPFEYAARDDNTGLNVPEPGCFTFDGEHALAYVRSRHYEYEDPPGSGDWSTDPTSDLGRISRQQDFLRRTLASLLDTGPLNPRVARGLIRATTEYITTDRDLTPAEMMEFAGVMNDVDPGSILTYQIEANGRTIGGAAVLVPNLDGDNMQAVLAIFRGEMSLADAPDQVFEPTTAAASRDTTTTTTTTLAEDSSTPGSSAAAGSDQADSAAPDATDADESTSEDAAETSAPDSTSGPEEAAPPESTAVETTVEGEPVQNEFGIVPPRDQVC